MAHKIRWSLESSDDLERIADFISRDSANYARIVISKIIDAAKELSRFPEMGRMVPEYGEESVREVFVYNFRLIYKKFEKHILIIAVIHGKRILNIANRI